MNLVAAVISMCLLSDPSSCTSQQGKIEAKACHLPAVKGEFNIRGMGPEMVKVIVKCD